MITPTFTVSQDDDSVTIVITAPHIKTQNVDFEVDGPVFKFNLKPYFLRLTFPGNVVDDERAKATYNVGAGELTVILPKESPGEHFPDLDMLTKLLVRKGDLAEKQIKRPLIEVISSGDTLEGTQKLEIDENFDWEMPQEIRQEIFSEVRYGFNNRYSGFFTHVQETPNDVLDVYDPEHATLETRRQNRIQRENDKFDDEYYMSDFMTEEEIQHLLKYKTPWWNELRAIQKAEKDASSKKTKLDTSLSTSNRNQESTPSPIPATTTTFKSTLLSSHTSSSTTPSIFNIVKDVAADTASPVDQDSFGLKEISTKALSSKNTESGASKPLILDLEPTSAPSTATLIPLEEPLIDESEPVKYLGPEAIAIVDPSRPSLNNELEDNMAGLSLAAGDSSAGVKPFSAKEQELMRDLPRREYILENTKSTYLGLIDILFAYSYDLRVSEGDATVETAWTICKLSPTISALDQFTTLKETIFACFRRALAYPLVRNWSLSLKILQDVYVILKLGRRGILRVLLAIKEVLDHDDVYYIYSKMFIEDYCVWIQSSSENVIRTLAHELHHFKIEKADLGWHLEGLEALAKEAPDMEDEEEEEEESSEEESDDEDDTSSDDESTDEDDSSSEGEDSHEDDDEKNPNKAKEGSVRIDEEESIFIQDGPKPMIIEL
ncbi:SHQ1 protein-domain-containing protein [Gamsiella multidivaricata]|uniref:SHQ1 protein-domain-containing protein n=1 Tax=Gamsiella multidivaricata TaxID=101098 RepID=UPI00221FFF69|nr:SHQ1 protein-domain-containing protein [Gamsiella multidivaricata]KAG0364658.1 Hsp90 cochaperone shq1 [Gamsiella multidivaricata]KAI7828948.1 SHQ1 protein-domain-containing protein [Gamsiella multidivaricata]